MAADKIKFPYGVDIAGDISVSGSVGNANGVLAAGNLLEGYATTATASGTTTLTVSSKYQQYFTGSAAQTVQMPATSTLVLGQQYMIVNNSTGLVTVNASNTSTIIILAAGASVSLTCISISVTTPSAWSIAVSNCIATTGKKLVVGNNLTLSGTDGTTMTFPSTNASIARTDAAQTLAGIQTITNITLPTNGQVLFTVPTTDGHATGPTTSAFNAGYSSSAVGDLVYLDSSGTWQKCDANTLALYNGLLGIALQIKASGNALLVALPGSFVYAAAAFPTFTIGGPIYMSETPGAVTQTAPTTTDAAIRVIGWAVHADKMYFYPSPDYITIV